MEEVGEPALLARIETRLTQLRISAEAASKQAGLSRDFIRNLRSGKSGSPRVDSLRKLAQSLECSLAYLLDIEVGVVPRPLSSEEDQLLYRYRMLPETSRSLVTMICQAFLQTGRQIDEPRRAKGGRK